MTIRHLKIFIAVAECGSMSAAAQALYLSQPTVSQAVQELEQHYQARLFERLSRRLYITEAGKHLLSLAHQAVDQFELLEQDMLLGQAGSYLRIGSSITVGTCLIPSVIQDLEQEFPGIRLYSLVSNTREIEKKLLQSDLDAAVVEGSIEASDLISIPIIHDRLILCCGQDHAFYQRDRISSLELMDQRFAMRESGSGTRKLFEQYLSSRGLRIQIFWEANSPRTILNAVTRNRALAVMSSRLMRHEIARNSVRIFLEEGHEWDRDFKLVYHKNKFLTPELRSLERILKKYQKLELPKGQITGVLHDGNQ